MSEQTIFNLITIFVAIASAVFTYQAHRYTQRRNSKLDQSADIRALAEALERLEGECSKTFTSLRETLGAGLERISKLEGTSEMSWRILEIYAGKTLHRHEDELHVDYYLDNYETLTASEVQRFIERLHQIAADTDIADGTKLAAAVKLATVVRRYSAQYPLILPER